MQGFETLRRKNVVVLIIVGVLLVYVLRLAVLQLFSSEYKTFADSNAFYKKTIYPARGSIYDRKGNLLVYNKPAYDIMLTVREMVDLDTLEFCATVGITRSDFDQRMEEIKDRRKNPGYSSYTPQLFLSQLNVSTYGVLQEKLFHFRGFTVRSRSLREYIRPIAAHALGYVAEVNRRDIEKDPYYVLGDYSGRSGIEKEYEAQLRGVKGVEVLLRDAHGRVKGRYDNGAHDVKAQVGRDLTLSIDADLQAYAEKLMVNKRGAIVAIEPKTGEILAYVSAPTYDPSLLVGRNRADNYKLLASSPQKIFLNRPIQSNYPPGSTFKPAQALVLMQEGIMTPFNAVECHRGYYYAPHHKVGCHSHPSPVNLISAVANSCNAYFCYGYRAMMDNRRKYSSVQDAMDRWRDYMVTLGFGYKLGVDLPYEKRGMIPNSTYYNKWYGKRGWKGATIISNAIGQGEVLATPMQIANLCAVIANKGWFVTPHLVKKVKGVPLDTAYTRRHITPIDSTWFYYIQQGMFNATQRGTSTGVSIPGIDVCGKTGTAQNAGADHSIFMCFAPRQDPKICLLVFVENGGFGAEVAVPIASLLLEKYLRGAVDPSRIWKEENVLKTNLMSFVSP
jgi:penicillin-binding protein 2